VTERRKLVMEGINSHKKAHKAQKRFTEMAKSFSANDDLLLCFMCLLRLDAVSHRALEVRAIVAAQGELFAVLHDDSILAVKPRLHLFDLVDLHDG